MEGLIHKTDLKRPIQKFRIFIYSSFLIPALTDIRNSFVAENAENIESQTQLHVETEAALADASQQWTDEKREEFVESTNSTEVLRSWEHPMTAPRLETLSGSQTPLEIVASTEDVVESKDSEGEVEESPSVEGHGDAQKVVVCEEVEALDKTVLEESTTELDLAVQAESPACVEEATCVPGEAPVFSSEAEEETEEASVSSETPAFDTAEGHETKKENCDIAAAVSQSAVPGDSSEQGEAVFIRIKLDRLSVLISSALNQLNYYNNRNSNDSKPTPKSEFRICTSCSLQH